MKSYLEGCGVPTTHIGQAEIPRLIMGIHPYDGCSYQPEADQDKHRAPCGNDGGQAATYPQAQHATGCAEFVDSVAEARSPARHV